MPRAYCRRRRGRIAAGLRGSASISSKCQKGVYEAFGTFAPRRTRDLEISSADDEVVSELICSASPRVAVSRFLRAASQGILSCGSSFKNRLYSIRCVVVGFWRTLR
jgi:hypothetical protein